MSDPSFDMGDLLKRAQELQGKVHKIQEELRHRTVDVTVGGGMVEASVNGHLELVKLRIDPQAVDPRDVEMLQDLIVAAVNQGTARAREMVQQEMQQATGMPIGDLMNSFGGGQR